MGCHTWFYRKIERTQEEAKLSCLEALNKSRNLNWEIYKNRNYKGFDWSHYKDDYLLKRNDILCRKIRMVENNLCQRAVWNHQNDEELTVYIEGRGLYIEDTGYHDLFRIHSYPEDILFSLEDSLDFIKKNDIKDYSSEQLFKFWNDYPNAIIKFG